ncbi:MAG: IPT/TIG domain-containing protein, partial [Blastocatellia bacterium]
VRNPGGKPKDAAHSLAPVYTLLPGPPPSSLSLNSLFATSGPSLGGSTVDIQGTNMDFTKKVSIGGTRAVIISISQGDVKFVTPAHVAGAAQIVDFDVDGAAPNGTMVPGGAFQYNVSVPVRFPTTGYVIVGPGEDVIIVPGSVGIERGVNSCVAVQAEVKTVAGIPPGLGQFVPTGAVLRLTDAFCVLTGCPTPFASGAFTVTWDVANSKQMAPIPAGAQTAINEVLNCIQ